MIGEIRFTVSPQKEDKKWGRYIIAPLPAGFGSTIGYSLRRILMGSLPGTAVTKMKIKGALHVFTTLKGVKEDLVQVMLNVKQIRFDYQGRKPVTLKVEKFGPGKVKAKDIKLQPGVKVVNPDLVLATLADKKSNLKMDLVVSRGVGYELAEEHKSSKLGVIGVDSAFSPVTKVSHQFESVREGKKINLDKLTIDIWTDGSMKPREALESAAKILVEVFSQIVKSKPIKKKEKKEAKNHNLELLIEEVSGIPLRLANALKKAGFKRIKDLADAESEEILKAKNVGEKSIELLKKVLKKQGIELK